MEEIYSINMETAFLGALLQTLPNDNRFISYDAISRYADKLKQRVSDNIGRPYMNLSRSETYRFANEYKGILECDRPDVPGGINGGIRIRDDIDIEAIYETMISRVSSNMLQIIIETAKQ